MKEHSSLISHTSSEDVNAISFDFQCSLFRKFDYSSYIGSIISIWYLKLDMEYIIYSYSMLYII